MGRKTVDYLLVITAESNIGTIYLVLNGALAKVKED